MAEFPESSRSVIELALETCSYDETKARQLLTSFNSTKTTTAAAAASVTVVSTVSAESRVTSASDGDTSATASTVATPSDVTVTVSARPRSAMTQRAGNDNCCFSRYVTHSMEICIGCHFFDN